MSVPSEILRLKALGISHRQAARHIGVTETHMSRMLHRSGGAEPSVALRSYLLTMEFLDQAIRVQLLKALDQALSGQSIQAISPVNPPVRFNRRSGRGRPTVAETNEEAWALAEKLWHDPLGGTVNEIAYATGISRATLNRRLGSIKRARNTSQK
ncbi:hypothetical protein SAMN02744133_108170 [Thalassospira xiamenensis M-5 = DSM 17429]|uniref:helix-turn-helix transcriptional regulator n=1 Tax=Thalassospira xiamenensis TaxID=220697 RepID=UPI000956121A|nr:hypothetical protein [Thalassospira xiamenensis]SIT22220.1 hypothetical protein SAMN02744133_108170 [Thalassospira xiamenensis M-5 = DSM 17429]